MLNDDNLKSLYGSFIKFKFEVTENSVNIYSMMNDTIIFDSNKKEEEDGEEASIIKYTLNNFPKNIKPYFATWVKNKDFNS